VIGENCKMDVTDVQEVTEDPETGQQKRFKIKTQSLTGEFQSELWTMVAGKMCQVLLEISTLDL